MACTINHRKDKPYALRQSGLRVGMLETVSREAVGAADPIAGPDNQRTITECRNSIGDVTSDETLESHLPSGPG